MLFAAIGDELPVSSVDNLRFNVRLLSFGDDVGTGAGDDDVIDGCRTAGGFPAVGLLFDCLLLAVDLLLCSTAVRSSNLLGGVSGNSLGVVNIFILLRCDIGLTARFFLAASACESLSSNDLCLLQ